MADPFPICHLNGALLPLRAARVSPLDRGFLFADAVYEVIAVHAGRATRLNSHLQRLADSLAALRIRNPHDAGQWSALLQALITANGAADLYVYLQISRGAEYGRNHAPLPELTPTVFAFCAPLQLSSPAALAEGVACITAADTRWARCDIKSVALLANVLLRQQAVEAGAAEAILLRDGWLTDASSSAVHVVINGEIRTPPRSHLLLPGTMRALMEELASTHAIPCHSVPVSERELRAADEIWLSSATRGVIAVTSLDGQPIGDGRAGPLWRRMRPLVEANW
ncbi:MAG: aminotransferase class IV [Steroidobacteraceae bacterium]